MAVMLAASLHCIQHACKVLHVAHNVCLSGHSQLLVDIQQASTLLKLAGHKLNTLVKPRSIELVEEQHAKFELMPRWSGCAKPDIDLHPLLCRLP